MALAFHIPRAHFSKHKHDGSINRKECKAKQTKQNYTLPGNPQTAPRPQVEKSHVVYDPPALSPYMVSHSLSHLRQPADPVTPSRVHRAGTESRSSPHPRRTPPVSAQPHRSPKRRCYPAVFIQNQRTLQPLSRPGAADDNHAFRSRRHGNRREDRRRLMGHSERVYDLARRLPVWFVGISSQTLLVFHPNKLRVNGLCNRRTRLSQPH